MDKVTLKAADGVPLAARIFAPAGTPRGNVVIGGAMGVRQDYYGSFAAWLAGQGWRVTTFDYRGSGHSAPARGLASRGRSWLPAAPSSISAGPSASTRP